jgi:hypothetical protein
MAYVSGATRLEVKDKLALRLDGVPTDGVPTDNRCSRRPNKVACETVKYALSLLLPLDHIMRYERQQKAVAILEQAIRYAEVGLDMPSQSEPLPAPAIPRQRPVWLDALPVRQDQSA